MTLKILFTFFILLSIILFPVIFLDAFGEEPILISISPNLDQVIFDGKWTHSGEWKISSNNNLVFDDGSKIFLRTAHQENFLYVLINAEFDKVINIGSDSAIVCFDTKNDKTIIPQIDDYCFSTSLGRHSYFTYQGGGISAIKGFFKKITNDKDFIAVGTASDQNDKHSGPPHASYEFRIPLDVIGRSDNYGFYISVFDADTQNHYSWPYNIKKQSLLPITSPSEWGDLVSPDKSLPEFHWISLILLITTISMIFASRFGRLSLFS